jgi:hypothetical protein
MKMLLLFPGEILKIKLITQSITKKTIVKNAIQLFFFIEKKF